MEEIKFVKPKVWNFRVVDGKDAWKEVVYSARMSGVPPQVKDKDVFSMMVENDYGSALEHIIIKFDVRLSKGNAPEFLEHRMMSHSGYSTRYIEVSKGMGHDEPAYEFILPAHMLNSSLKEEGVGDKLRESLTKSLESYLSALSKGTPREIARYVLPFGQAVGIYHVTLNLRSLLNMLSLRLCVRSSPEFRCIASQLYFGLLEDFPEFKGLIGCRGFIRGACPESNVTGVRVGKQHAFYTPCPFKMPGSNIYIPTLDELRNGAKILAFNTEKAAQMQETLFKKWASWE